MFFAAASAAALLQGRRAEQQRPVWWGMGFGVLSFAALLSKETIVYYLPFYLVIIALDGRRRRNLRFWGATLGVSAILILAYLLFYQVVAHDALYRIHAIEYANATRQSSNYSLDKALLARITYMPLLVLLGTGLASVLLPTLLALTQWRRLDTDGRFWLALAISALAFYWFGSTSFTYYNPNSLLPRMLTQ
jgi:4-amino-4-deoxy-L-arabinose transferase-like glycosyltransferase